MASVCRSSISKCIAASIRAPQRRLVATTGAAAAVDDGSKVLQPAAASTQTAGADGALREDTSTVKSEAPSGAHAPSRSAGKASTMPLVKLRREIWKWTQDQRKLRPTQLAHMLFSLARLRFVQDFCALAERDYLIAQVCDESSSDAAGAWSAYDIGRLCYGLQAWQGSDAIAVLVRAAADKAIHSGARLDGKQVAMAFFGLHRCDDGPDVQRLIVELTASLAASERALGGQQIGNVLFGLQRCGSSSSAVRELLALMVPKILDCSHDVTSQSWGNALWGLQRCEDCPELRATLAALAKLVEQDSTQCQEQHISQAMYGLRTCGMSAESLAVLRALVPKIEGMKTPFRAQGVGNALYGLQRFSDCEVVRAVLGALSMKIAACNESMLGQAFSNALYGLHRCGDTPEMRSVLAVIAVKLENSDPSFTSQDLSCAVYGLHTCADSQELRHICRLLVPRLAACTQPVSPQGALMMFRGLMGCSAEPPEVQDLLATLASNLADPRWPKADLEWEENHVAAAFAGLELLSAGHGCQRLMCALAPKVSRLSESLKSNVVARIEDVLSQLPGEGASAVAQALPGSQVQPTTLPQAPHDDDPHAGPPLPAGWSQHWDDSGRAFYHHPKHGSQWMVPGLSLPPGWTAHFAREWGLYYTHAEFGSTHDLPKDEASR